jgi:hypothetical protein
MAERQAAAHYRRMPEIALLLGYLIAYGSVILFVLWLIALLTESDGESSQRR